ncbi:N,N-dimethylformamidase beta subunit family domain-containing protein [Pararoseomonas indoligenes]|uniref:N,N-dimethylformamidase large subunit n=1 Tax=Roseomonas indoligenes TaxID=2820811 RepID=A0A940N6Q9_9PROT|nr:N,N-dimethylformamidase beta subunit family domain-containing protein [Pararoseomonas indoligenes]MBP0496145.1 N,N-dimethylformamidase large subunit [Pararoseomonas indoligenes]
MPVPGAVDTTAILGYALPLTVSPGEEVRFHLSSPAIARAEAAVARVRCADPDPDGPGLKLVFPGTPIDGVVPLREQPLYPGSCAIVPDAPALAALSGFTAGAFLWPTAPGLDYAGTIAQTVLARWCEETKRGWRLGLDAEGRPEFVVADGTGSWRAVSPHPLLEREWVLLGGSWDPAAREVRITVRSLDPQSGRDRSATVAAPGPAALSWPADTVLTMAGHAAAAGPSPRVIGLYDGKLDRPRLYAAPLPPDALHRLCEALRPDAGDPLLLAAWDLSEGMDTDRVRDRSANRLDGTLLQMPARAMTGANWDGSTRGWTEAPWQYGAIHFHRDDMADAGWEPDLRLTVPADWRPGFYALRLRARTEGAEPVESFVAFFVRAPVGRPSARLAFVASTATFLAYANSALRLDQVHAEAMLEGLIALSPDDVYLQSHRELGLSTYDTHNDGSGWKVSTAARPILNMRPRGATFNYGNDTHVLDWLEHFGETYDIVTDEDIDRHGVGVLRPYACVITGSHPEYVSRPMLDAFDAYQRGGGRHIYLGGNGFYWRIAFHPERPHAMEVRRGMIGLRTWEGEAGEDSLAFTGEPSGTWRTNGRPPQRLVGVGFDAQVFTASAPYRWLDGARDPALAWLTEGIDLDAPLGEFGLRGGGAAGIEVDRVEPTLGSPPGLVWLATADRLGYGGVPVPEESRTLHRGMMGDQNARVRADLVFFTTAGGGAVFSTGSIAYACALTCKDYENNVSRLTRNVLRRFLDPSPL